jgi:TM2 domain-containing membrane protein YozV
MHSRQAKKNKEKGTMKHAIKGGLLSGLIFPGLGQVVLKRYGRGVVIILAVLVSLFVAVVTAVQHALVILEKIQSRGGEISMKTISDAATRASSTSVSLIFNLALLMIIFCWIFGIIDAYRIGRKKDIEEGSTALASNGND